MQIKADSTDQSVSFAAYTTATGAAVTVTSATAGLSLWYRRGGVGAKTAISPSNLATLETAHTDGGILVIQGQDHRLDLPDAAVAAGVAFVEWGGTATDITIDGGRAELIGQENTAPVAGAGGKVPATVASGDDADAASVKSTIGAAGAGLTALATQASVNAIAASIGTGTGARTVTITVNDGADPLESVRVRLTKGASSYVGSTNASGVVTFHVDDGTWTVAATLTGYTYAGTTIVVDGDETATYSMTAQTITAPSAASLCTVQFRVNLSGTAVSGAVCKAKLQGINQASDGTILSNAESSDTTDALGVAELELVQKSSIIKGSGVYRIWVEIAGNPVASVETTIPNQSTILYEDLL